MVNILKYIVALSLLFPTMDLKKDIKPERFFPATTKVIGIYREYGPEKYKEENKGVIRCFLDNNFMTYNYVTLDSLKNIIQEKEKTELDEERRRMIITTITKEWFDYTLEEISKGSSKINPKNNFVFNLEELNKTIDVFFEFEERYGLDWKTTVAQGLTESRCNLLKYGALDEIGLFHVREKTAKDLFRYVKKRFSDDEYASVILGKEFDKEKLMDPEYNLFFYLVIMDGRLRESKTVEEALRKYNSGIYWQREERKNYSDVIMRNLNVLSIYEQYSKENPEGFALFYLMTLFPELRAENVRINENFWSSQDVYENESLWKTLYKINKNGYFDLVNEVINDSNKEQDFKKHYETARDFVKRSTLSLFSPHH